MKKTKSLTNSSDIFCIYGICIKKNLPNITIDDRDPKSLEVYIGNDKFEGIYLGRSWCDMRDNETGAQFKRDVEDRIKEIFGKNIKCRTIYAEQYDEGL